MCLCQIQQSVDATFVMLTESDGDLWVQDEDRDVCSYDGCAVKFGLMNRRHHCRSCGDIFCKTHCLKALVRRNENLEVSESAERSAAQSPFFSHKGGQMAPVLEQNIHSNHRELRICPPCGAKKSHCVDLAHRHRFMDCECLGWSVRSIDFALQWKRFQQTVLEFQ